MTAPFLIAVLLLLLVSFVIFFRPWWQRRRDNRLSQEALNVAICREQLAELDTDRSAGTLSEANYGEAERELQRRLLRDTEVAEAPLQATSGRRTLYLLLLFLPVAAAGLYALLGTPSALKAGAGEDKGAQIEAMVSGLAARLEKNPDDPAGWAMLARSYKAMGRLEASEKAFVRIGSALEENADLLASYADVLAARADGKIEGRPLELINKALALDPEQPMALSIAGAAAFARGDGAQAASYWQRLLRILPEGSEEAQDIAAALAKLRGAGKLPALAVAAGSVKGDAIKKERPVAAVGSSLAGRVELKPGIKANADDTVFIFARAAEGSRMPLAIRRAKFSDLPLAFVLDQSNSMAGGTPLAEAGKLVVEARISRSGEARPVSGDWFGRSTVVVAGAKGLRIVIDQQIP